MVLEPTLEDVPTRRLNPEGGGHEAVCQQGRWTLKGGGFEGPTSIGEGNECQQGRWVLKGVDCEISHRLGRRTNTLQKGVETYP